MGMKSAALDDLDVRYVVWHGFAAPSLPPCGTFTFSLIRANHPTLLVIHHRSDQL